MGLLRSANSDLLPPKIATVTMGVTLSVATSADGYIDDNSATRLVLSTPEDWVEVYDLRAKADAIVIGAETLRRDNPRLSLKSDSLRQERVEARKTAEPHKVIISRRGAIDPSLRLFESPYKNIIIFSEVARPELDNFAEVVVEEQITAASIRTHLEKRGLNQIFVEGGAQILNLFLSEGCADRVRIARNPQIIVGDAAAPRFDKPLSLNDLAPDHKDLGGMEIELYAIRERDHQSDIKHLERAIEISRKCTPSPTSYCVGAVIVTAKGEIFEGYTHETSSTHHAEQEAVKKAEKAGADLKGATMYSSMEPCSTRASEPESCSAIMIRHKFARAIFALYEPSCFVCCKGALNMRLAGIDVECINSLSHKVLEINSHLF
ncbi:MAG: dihydrofolate reductase family protein [Rikenellaceae bacterium]